MHHDEKDPEDTDRKRWGWERGLAKVEVGHWREDAGAFGSREHIREEAQGVPALIFHPREADSFPKWWEPSWECFSSWDPKEPGNADETPGWKTYILGTSSTQWTWVWANCGRWWRTGKPGVLQSIGSQRVRHHWVTKQQELEESGYIFLFVFTKVLLLVSEELWITGMVQKKHGCGKLVSEFYKSK